MAKDKENQDSIESGDSQDKQVPVKPKRRLSGDMGLIKILIIIGATVFLMFGMFFAGYVFLIKPDLQLVAGNGSSDAHGNKNGSNSDKKKSSSKEESEFMSESKEGEFAETGRITTNPMGAQQQFVVVNLGMEYLKRKKEGEEEAKGAHAEGEHPFGAKTLAKVRGGVNSVLGSLTVDELFSMKRDSLQSLFLIKLKPIMKKEDIYLRSVILQEFIVQ